MNAFTRFIEDIKKNPELYAELCMGKTKIFVNPELSYNTAEKRFREQAREASFNCRKDQEGKLFVFCTRVTAGA